jgi:hypothetical protein
MSFVGCLLGAADTKPESVGIAETQLAAVDGRSGFVICPLGARAQMRQTQPSSSRSGSATRGMQVAT